MAPTAWTMPAYSRFAATNNRLIQTGQPISVGPFGLPKAAIYFHAASATERVKILHIKESEGYTVIPQASCYNESIEGRQAMPGKVRLPGKRGSHG